MKLKKTFHGSCHCGAVRFEADIDLDQGTSKCNCSSCAKGRFWKAIVGADAMRMIAGNGRLTEYQFGRKAITHFFCQTCGVKPFGRGEMENTGVFYGINLACLDDLTPEELLAAPLEYQDGKHDHWERIPEEARHL
ncbi:GFA family protein [Phyllobacterium brassicacearum]|uniref:GFA family protein n=1 Tax=Phyllobacterium brassicacearum TaxID=314235 RepID=UPI003CC9DCD1